MIWKKLCNGGILNSLINKHTHPHIHKRKNCCSIEMKYIVYFRAKETHTFEYMRINVAINTAQNTCINSLPVAETQVQSNVCIKTSVCVCVCVLLWAHVRVWLYYDNVTAKCCSHTYAIQRNNQFPFLLLLNF